MIPSSRPERNQLLLLLGVAFAALALRVLRIDRQSLWYDEAATWWNATRSTWVETVWSEANHPPVWWLVTRAWLAFFPGAEAALRMPAALCGAAAVVLAYFLSRRLADPAHAPSRGGFRVGDRAVPIAVAALAAVNAFWIEYAQEARMYSALLAEALGLSLLYLRYLDRPRRRTLVAYAAVAALGLYTHYYAGLVVAGHAAHALLLWRRKRRSAAPFSPRPLLLAQGAAALAFAPWLVVLVARRPSVFSHPMSPFQLLANALWHMGTGPGLATIDAPQPGDETWTTILRALPVVVAPALMWFVPIILGLRAIWRDPGTRDFVLSSVLIPICLALLVSVRWTLVNEKYLIFVAPFLLHLAVVGVLSVRGPWRVIVVGGLILLHGAALVAYHAPETPGLGRLLVGEHPYGKEQWRDLHRWVVERAGPDDVVLLHAPMVHPAWAFYESVPEEKGALAVAPALLPPTASSPDLDAAEVARLYPNLAHAREVFLVLSHQTTHDPYYYSDVVLEALRIVQPDRVWDREKKLFPQAWGVRVHRFYSPTSGS